jgi:hypothetical protein
MLKTVSSITNAIGALNYKGTWNATTNTPTLASGVGTKGDYYQVSVAGSTSLDGISNWGVGDVVAFNGTTWQRIEGGADLNGVNLTATGTVNFASATVSNGGSVTTVDINGGTVDGATVGASTPSSVSATTFKQLNSDANDTGKYGRKTYFAQSSIDNPVVDLATFGNAAGQNLMAKVTVYHAAFAGGAVSVGYARYGDGGTNTIVAMALEANLGITNLGTLAFSGAVLQYTANRVNNFDWYSIVVEIGGGATVSNF